MISTLFLFKLSVVPGFIAAVTVAGRKWGAGLAGLLAGCPVVAGPIVVFMAIEQGAVFGAKAALATLFAVNSVLVFGVLYSHASRRWRWPGALVAGLGGWLVLAMGLAQLPQKAWLAAPLTALGLLLAPKLMPEAPATIVAPRHLRDLPVRMAAGALLTLLVTGIAALLGETWSGLLAAFPIISLVLAVFTHMYQGAGNVALLFAGLIRGLYSFSVFFLLLALLLPGLGVWAATLAGIMAAIGMQLVLRLVERWRSV